jgi:ComF family protein
LNHLSKNSGINLKISDLFNIKIIGWSLSDFISPVHCLVCNTYFQLKNNRSKFICNKCYDNIPFADDKEVILNRFYKNFNIDNCYISEATSLMNLLDESNYLEIIHGLKYQKFQSIGFEFGKLLANRIKFDSILNYDFVVPIPIHPAKRRERGFNQSDIIAKSVSEELGLNYNDKILVRSKYTITQTLLNKDERMKNVANVFSLTKTAEIRNKSVLLIDDVLTTGSTINFAAEILIKSGASKVGTATIALAH